MEDYREDLFPDIDKNVARRKKRKKLKLITAKNIYINEEKICAAVVLFIFLMVASYVGGYKKGIKVAELKKGTDVILSAIKVEDVADTVEASNEVVNINLSEAEDDKVSNQEEGSGLKFALQVVTYKSMEYAESERDKLKKMGFPSYIRKQGKYRIVFVGDYSEQSEAINVLRELRKTYRDAFMKELKGGK